MSKLLIPNTTQVPNVILDKLMPILPPAPLKVVLVIARFTYGFQKRSEKIGFKQLSTASGLSRRAAIDAVQVLGDLIHVKPGGPGKGPNEYSLNLDISEAQLMALIERIKSRSGEVDYTSEVDCTSAVQRKKVVKYTAPFQTNISEPNKSTESDKLIPDFLFPISDKSTTPQQSGKRIANSSPTSKKRKPAAPDPTQLEAFSRFYEASPRRVAKDAAYKAWLKLNPDESLRAVIMAGVGRYREERADSEPKFISHPATWLNRRRWEDEPARATSNANGHSNPFQVKDLGNGMVEVDGLKMLRADYERKYAKTTC